MKTLRLSAILACAALVAGCATPMARRSFELTPQTKTGLVVASFTNDWMKDVTWKYRPVGQQTGTSSDLRVSTDTMDVIRGAKQVLYAFELPEGEYEFFAWVQNATYMYSVSAEVFSIRFRAYAGRATYIGNVELLTDILDSKHFRLDVRDFAKYDVPLFLKNYPRITADQVQVAPMRLLGKSAAGEVAAVEPVAYRPATMPALTLALPEPANEPGVLHVRFANADETDQKGWVWGFPYSEKTGDAAMVQRDFSNGVLTYTGQAGFGRGSKWTAFAVVWHPKHEGTTDASGYKTVTLRLASNVRRIHVSLESTSPDDCYPFAAVDVTDQLAEYTIPLSRFAPSEECKGTARPVAETLPQLRNLRAMASAPADGKPVSIAIGTTTFRE